MNAQTHNQNPIAAALNAAGVTSTTFAAPNYYCPLDTLDDKIGQHAVLHSRVITSMAWYLDSACINQARNVLFARYAQSEIEGDDKFGNFCQDVAVDLDHESLYVGEQSNEQTLAQLLALRHHWHTAAQSACAAEDRDYNPKSLRDQMLAEKPRTADVGTRVNFEQMAKTMAHGDIALEKRMYATMCAANDTALAQRAEGSRKLMPTILEILRTASRYAPAETRFDHLPAVVQHRLTKAASATLDRTMIDLASRLSKQPIEFARISESAYQCGLTLNAILADKYSQVGELEYAGMPPSVDKVRREQKRAAISSID